MTLRWTGRARRAGIRVLRRLPPSLRRPLIRLARRVEQGRFLPRATDLAPRDGPWVERPEISVVVTSRNRSELLPIALRSIQKQDLDAFECIIVDDDSTDDAVLVAQSFAAVDPRFRILVHDAALGPAAARNSALAAARAPLVCFLDDDDFLLAGSLRSRRDALQGQPADVAGVFCDWINTDEHVGLEAFQPRRTARRRPGVSLGSLGDGTPFILSSPLLRTDVVRSVGGFDERLTRAEDADLWFRLARLGFRFLDAGCLGVAYRRTPGSLVTAAPGAQLDALLDVFERAERPDRSVHGHGPLPAPEPVSAVALSHARRGHILRYVALTAIDDFDRAVAAGERGLHPIVRRSIDVEVELPALRNHVAARLALDEMHMPTVDDAVRRVLHSLRPPIAERWQPLVDPGPWREALLARARAFGPRPPVTSAGIRTAVAGAVVLVPEARYHVDELGPIADELRVRGIPVQFMVSPKTVPAALDELGRYADHALAYAPDEIAHARALVTLNDWGPLKQLVEIANDAGVATFGKVEGVQDFDDIESTWERNPYRTVSYVLAQGANDVAALPEKDTYVVGSSRLERLWAAEPTIPGEHALVNLNFTFQVLTGHRDSWLTSVRDALGLAGVPMLVSTHPAERREVLGAPIATKPFRFEVTKAGIVVSRFSTVPFEAMARGVPFVYHNPHGERFPTFLDPGGAFLVCSSADELVDAAREALSWRGDYRHRCAEFFARQISIDPDRTSAARAADVIVRLTR